MKKWFIIGSIGVVLLLFLVWLGSDDELPQDDTTKVSESNNSNKTSNSQTDDGGEGYTFLVYMNGSDLESTWYEEYEEYGAAATTDLYEMMNGVSSDGVQVVIETGGTLQWANDFVSGEQNQRWLINTEGLIHVEDLGQKNMGESDTLADFVEWGVTNYPSDRYALVFWDHGGGSVLGFGVDEWFNEDSLSLTEIEAGLATAYDRTGVQLDLIGFDACLMATVETAAAVSDYGKYMVASQELEPGHGWDYTAIMNYLSTEPGATGAELGKAIVDSYEQHAIDQEQEKMITLSVVDLSKIDDVIVALEAFVLEAADVITVSESNFYRFAEGRSKAEDYGSTTAHGGLTDMTDLASIAKNVSAQYPNTSSVLEQAVLDAVVYNMNSSGRPDATGLSIYFPHKDKESFDQNLSIFSSLGFSTVYNDFLETYVSLLMGNDVGVAVKSSNKDEFSFAYNEDEDLSDVYEVYLDPNDLDRIEQIYGVVAMISDENDVLLYLGYDHYVNMDWDTGVLQDDFTGEWLTWNGNFVSLFLAGQGDDYIQYAIPAYLNGEEVEILVHYDIESDEFEVLGAWRGLSETTGMPDKNIIQISAGDEVIPLYYYYDEATDVDGYTEGEPFIVAEEHEFYYELLPNGLYLYGFSILDYSGNETQTDFVEIELID